MSVAISGSPRSLLRPRDDESENGQSRDDKSENGQSRDDKSEESNLVMIATRVSNIAMKK